MTTSIKTHIQYKIDFIQTVLTTFKEKFFDYMEEDDTCNPDNSIGIGEISKALGEEFGMSKQNMYILLRFLLEEYPQIIQKSGRYGGLYRVSKNFAKGVVNNKFVEK